MPFDAQVDPSIETDAVFKEIEIAFVRNGVPIRKGGLFIRDKSGIMGVLNAVASINNNVNMVTALFVKYYRFSGELTIPADLLTKLKLPVKDLQALTSAIRAAAAEHSLELPEVTELCGLGKSVDAIAPFGNSSCSREAKSLLWIVIGAPRTIPPAGSSVTSGLPVEMLPGRGPRQGVDPVLPDAKENKVTIKIPKSAVGQVVGAKGASKKAIEDEFGATFQLESALDPAKVIATGSLDKCRVFYGLIMDALSPKFSEKGTQCQIEEQMQVQVIGQSTGFSAFEQARLNMGRVAIKDAAAAAKDMSSLTPLPATSQIEKMRKAVQGLSAAQQSAQAMDADLDLLSTPESGTPEASASPPEEVNRDCHPLQHVPTLLSLPA